MKFKIELVEHWRFWWKRWSSWLAILNGMLVGHVFSQPILVIGLIGFSPGEYQVPLAIGAGFLAFLLPVIVANIRQPKLAATVKAERETKQGADDA